MPLPWPAPLARIVEVRDVWEPATGRGRLLVLEDGDGAPTPIGDAVVDAVLAHGGDVVFVEPGTLRDYGPVAFALRY